MNLDQNRLPQTAPPLLWQYLILLPNDKGKKDANARWPDLDSETMEKVKEKIDTGWEIHLK